MLTYLLHTSFLKIQFARTFPTGMISDKPLSGKALTESITMLGDSRVQLWPQNLISSKFKLINKGFGKLTSTQLIYHLNEKTINSNIVFIQTCINDFHWLNLTSEYEKAAIEQCKNNIIQALKILHKDGKKVILSTIIPPGNPSVFRKIYWPNNIENILVEVNIFIRSQKNELTYVLDASEILKQKNSQYIQDGFVDSNFFLHINSFAYKKLSKHLNKILFQF